MHTHTTMRPSKLVGRAPTVTPRRVAARADPPGRGSPLDALRDAVAARPAAQRVLLRLLASPGVSGSIAVVGGVLTKTDVLAAHWTPAALATGVAFAAPLALLDAALMVPDWQPASPTVALPPPPPPAKTWEGGDSDTADDDDGARAAEAARAALLRSLAARGAIVVDAATASSGGAPQPPPSAADRFQAAAHAWQSRVARGGSGLRLRKPVAEAGLIVAARYGSEALLRGLCVGAGGRWLADRFAEAGGEETLASLAARYLPPEAASTAAAGQLAFIAGWAAVLLGLGASALVAGVPPGERAAAAAGASSPRALAALRAQGATEPGQAATLAAALAKRVAATRADAAALAAVADAARVIVLGAAYTLTGNNLAVPLAASLATAAPLAAHRRAHAARVVAKRAAARAEFEQAMGGKLEEVRDRLKAKLEAKKAAERESIE